ncbi:N-acetyltransferase 6 [Trichogramma pretiosum]|uniref:N-acetyltransferase 6 n=1 Tax=Trichogramma pretiosum TaxID=7493 RepID=UPI0006C98E56|nr:N-acetyltransferase 6 [Trichogramma pretiosum]XP_014229035.1 N-acetyltransferase 6 [Trichogramma pretiosum]XP_023313810.1 N-acetyltransferase 6 [Trichogramma pretiosum]
MRDPWYNVVPLHERPDLIPQCCNLLNSEWKRSETARVRSLETSCRDKYFPTCLVLLRQNEVLGHCKLSMVYGTTDSVLLESFLIDSSFRSQGLGSLLLKELERYVKRFGITSVYLLTKGQEGFYAKNGYEPCAPIGQLNDYRDFSIELLNDKEDKDKGDIILTGPPPPPMPNDLILMPAPVCLTTPSRTFMKKVLTSSKKPR